jgi:hypothetical protein
VLIVEVDAAHEAMGAIELELDAPPSSPSPVGGIMKVTELAMARRCHLQPVRRSPPPCQADTTTTSPPPPSLSVPSRADRDELRSTWPQRAWTLAGTAAILSSLSTSASLVAAGSSTPAEPVAAALAAYSLADLATGVYHWFVDNHGDASTPVFGAQIAAFQGHHSHPSIHRHASGALQPTTCTRLR